MSVSILSAIIGLTSPVVVAKVMVLVSASLCSLMLFFALTASPAAIPVRVRRRR
jgi:hypothetical protein